MTDKKRHSTDLLWGCFINWAETLEKIQKANSGSRAVDNIKDKPIPRSYPQLQGKVEAYNKIVKNEFLTVEDISSIDEGKLRYYMFVKAYNETREHGGINGLTSSEMFLQTFNKSHNGNNTKQKSGTHVGNQNCYLSV